MILRRISCREQLEALEPRWNELAALNVRDGFFRSYSWCAAWLQHIRPDADPFVVVAQDRTGRIVGIAPLCRLKYRDLGFQLTALQWAGREVVSGDFLGIVCEDDFRVEFQQAVLRFLWDLRSTWDILIGAELNENSADLAAFEDFARENQLPTRLQEERLCPFIELPATFDEYLNTLGSSTRYHIRRRARDVEKRGGVIETRTGPEALSAALDTLTRLHFARWSKRGEPGTFGRPGFAPFLRQLFGTMPRDASCRIYELTHEGQPVAALMTFTFGQAVLYYQAGWDPDSPLADYSPAVVLMSRSIQDGIAAGCRYYEFLRGDEEYKSRWTKSSRNTVTVLLARGRLARMYLRSAQLKDAIKPFIRDRQRVAAVAVGAPVATMSAAETSEHR